MNGTRDISPLVAPASIAVIGASTSAHKPGGVLFSNLTKGGFEGPLYPINPGAGEVMGHKAYPEIGAVSGKVDLAYIVLPRHLVRPSIEQCIAAGTRAACIITAGFAEVDDAGLADQLELQKLARDAGLLLAGPNTIGMVNADCGMQGSFVNFPHWEAGGISLFTQTGIFTGALMLQVMNQDVQRLPVGKSIDVGNKIDVDELDFLEYAARDDKTRVIGFYLESIVSPDRFFKRAAEIAKTKPIVMLKPGRTKSGAVASRAHTGSLPQAGETFQDRFREAGIVEARDEAAFVDFLKTLAFLPKHKGKRLAIATTSGALGVISSDLAVEFGFDVPGFAPKTTDRLQTIVPDWLTPANPFDFWISLDIKGPKEAHEVALPALAADPNTDILLCTLLAPGNAAFDGFGAALAEIRKADPKKPIAMVIYGGDLRAQWITELEGLDIPVFASTDQAMRALAVLTA
jgi:acetyltransferase